MQIRIAGLQRAKPLTGHQQKRPFLIFHYSLCTKIRNRTAVKAKRCSITHRTFTACKAAAETSDATEAQMMPISLTEKALGHLKKLKAEHEGRDLLFRVGVRSGGCSGMSYVMEFESEENVQQEDAVFEYDDGGFRMICDPKSLLYLFGMRLDYSDALIGGGFQFHNPNATDTCGCGKSFGV